MHVIQSILYFSRLLNSFFSFSVGSNLRIQYASLILRNKVFRSKNNILNSKSGFRPGCLVITDHVLCH